MKSMMDRRMSVGKGAGVVGEVAGALIIVLMMKGTKDSNFCFLEAFFVSIHFSRSFASMCVFPVRASMTYFETGGVPVLVRGESPTKGRSTYE